jgi:hypothetical protein
MLILERIAIRDLWTDTGSGPGVTTAGRVVEVTVTGQPAARDALIAGMTEIEGPTEWQGNHYAYRDWRGYVLTMPVLVTERVNLAMPDAIGELVEQVDQPMCYGVPEGYRSNCRRPAPHGPHPIESPGAPAADIRPVLELVLDERFGKARGPVAPIEVIGQPDQSVEELTARFANVAGVVIVPGEPVDDGSVDAAWSRYARRRAQHYFGAKRFSTIGDARDAVRYWPGWDVLTPDDREAVAASLVEPARLPMPAVEHGTDRRRFLLLPSKRRRRASDANEVAF